MSAEKELEQWLHREEKTFAENLAFAIKICRSLEFALQSKYEIVFKWISKNLSKNRTNISLDELLELVSVSFPQHLVQKATKATFVQAIVDHITSMATNDSRAPIELLLKLADHPSFQTLYGSSRRIFVTLQSAIFNRYSVYFQSKLEFCASVEVSFFQSGLTSLKGFLRTRGNLTQGINFIQPLLEASLFLATEKAIYNEVLEILKMMQSFWKNAFSTPLHVGMYCMDFAINEYRSDIDFMAKLLDAIVTDQSPPERSIFLVAHILDLLRKYDVDVDGKLRDDTTIIDRLTAYIEAKLDQHLTSNPKEILELLCSTIRLRPMSLEKIMFRITVQFMLRPKTDGEWNSYIEYLVLILDVFKKLGRPEKLVLYLVKSLKVQLEMTGLSNSLKRRENRPSDGTPCKLRKTETSSVQAADNICNAPDRFINLLREEFVRKHAVTKRSSKWKNIYMAWPHDVVGKHFTRFVTTLAWRPSLVLWKSLIFSLHDSIQALRQSPKDERNIALIDFNSALLCEYLSGSRLPEQTDKFWADIKACRDVMENLLRSFGEMLLEYEHNNRTMDAFLEICNHAGYFDLAVSYYCPETQQIGRPELHGYLSKEQWVSLEQRIVNFGNSATKHSINQLHLQKMQLSLLYDNEKKSSVNDVRRYLLNETLDESKLVKGLFEDTNCSWLLERISKDDKRKICHQLLPDTGEINALALHNLSGDHDCLQLFVHRFFELMSDCIESKKSILKAVSTDSSSVEDIRDAIQSKIGTYSIKHCDTERLKYLVQLVSEHVPIGFCSAENKLKFFALSLALYRDAMAIGDDEIVRLTFDILSKIIHFGHFVNIFLLFDLAILMQYLPPTQFSELYNIIFENRRMWNKQTEVAIAKLIEEMKQHKFELSDDEVCLAIILFERRHDTPTVTPLLREMLCVVAEYIRSYFAKSIGKKHENDKAFARRTASIMPQFLKHLHATQTDLVEFDDDIKDIYRKYVILLRNDDSYSALISEARFFRTQLGFEDAELELILEEMWKQLLIDVKRNNFDLGKCEKILRNVTSHQTTERLLEMFNHIEESLTIAEACKILLCLTKCPFTAEEGSVLTSCCHVLLFNKIASFKKTEKGSFADSSDVLSVLVILEAICELKRLQISNLFMDDILAFLVDVRIRHYSVEEGDESRKNFFEIYKRMIRVCSALIQYRTHQTLNRSTQFVYVFRELVQTLLTYRSDRLKVSPLEPAELEQLGSFGHELENLTSNLARQQEVKRIAPYLLTYIINAMVVNNRSTVRFPKIKLHIENICYKLIPLCDYYVKSFILRCSSDATRQIYENLCKDYYKYQKFKGKV